MSLSQRIIDAERKLEEAKNALAAAIAFGTPGKIDHAYEAWRAAQEELSDALEH